MKFYLPGLAGNLLRQADTRIGGEPEWISP